MLAIWAKIIAAVADIIRKLVDVFVQTKWENVGRMKEQQANEDAQRDLADRIARADAKRVSDDEAFGSREDNPVSRPDKG